MNALENNEHRVRRGAVGLLKSPRYDFCDPMVLETIRRGTEQRQALQAASQNHLPGVWWDFAALTYCVALRVLAFPWNPFMGVNELKFPARAEILRRQKWQ